MSDNARLSDMQTRRRPRRFRRIRWPKAPPWGTVRHARAPRFVRTLGSLDRLGGGVPGLGARPPPPETEAEAGFLAGAALARLDAIVRENPPWAGAWRQRLALAAAAASVRRAGRNEDEAALRDALHLTRSGADPGPAGRRLLAWRALAVGTVGQWRSAIARAAEALANSVR